MQTIGGSRAAAALGLDPYKTPYQLFLEMTGRSTDDIDPELSYWGNADEPAILARYERDTGRKIIRTYSYDDEPIVHPDIPWMTARPDGITACNRITDWKISAQYGVWGDDIPTRVMVQMQHNMAVTGCKVADVALRLGLYQFRIYPDIQADPELQALIIEGEKRFMERVAKDDAPDPAWEAPETRKLLQKAYPGTSGEILTADSQMEHWLAVYLEASEKLKQYESAATAAQNHMLYTMKDAAVLKFSNGKELRRKLTKRKGYTVADSEYIDSRFVNSKE